MQHNYALMLVPRRTVLCDKILEDEGVFGEVHMSLLQLRFDTEFISNIVDHYQ